jgi:putative alpha-1,2-mannosidase
VLNGNDDYSSVEYKKLSNDEKETVMVSGYTKVNSGGVGDENSDFSHFFVAFVYRGLKGNEPSTFLHSGASKDGAYVDFDGTSPLNDLLTVRFATSFISIDQAIANLQQEVDSSKSFDEVRKSARDAWQAVLGRVKVEEVSKDYSASEAEGIFSTFYSCMYRASLFPRLLTEVAADGSLMHWSPYAKSSNTRVMPGHLSADSGFWDAYSTVYPGLSLWNRPMLTNLINGWINAYKEGSWLPPAVSRQPFFVRVVNTWCEPKKAKRSMVTRHLWMSCLIRWQKWLEPMLSVVCSREWEETELVAY